MNYKNTGLAWLVDDVVETQQGVTLFCRTLTSLCDENKLCVSYLQPKFTKSPLNGH